MSDEKPSTHPDHPAAQKAAGFAGMPELARAASGGAAPTRPRTYTEYTIPAQFLSDEYEYSKFGDDDRTFRLIEMTPGEQAAASKAGGHNQAVVAQEMLYRCIVQVGSWRTGSNRADLEAWMAAIGPRAGSLVSACFVKTMSVEEEDVATFLATGTKGRA